MDEKVINFYQFVATYSPKVAMTVSANGQGWQAVDAETQCSRQNQLCILEDGHNIVVSRMKNTIIADRAIDDKNKTLFTFSLAIDAMKVAWKKYIFEARMLKEDVLGYEDIAVHENDHRCKDIVVHIRRPTEECQDSDWPHPMGSNDSHRSPSPSMQLGT
eukprot:scaffold31167_cov70-Attheya_sp.AAC.3